MRLARNQLFDLGARGLDAAFQSLSLGAQRVEEFGQLDYRDRQRDWISFSVPAKIEAL
jgi:hypothetical protein